MWAQVGAWHSQHLWKEHMLAQSEGPFHSDPSVSGWTPLGLP